MKLAEVNTPALGTGKVVFAHLHPGETSTSFGHSLLGSFAFDMAGPQRLITQHGGIAVQGTVSGAGRLAGSRNMAVAQFLAGDGEWLWTADSDMGWDEDALERLLATADPQLRPVVGGLCFGAKYQGDGPAHAGRVHFFPTLYRWDEEACCFSLVYDWDRGSTVKVDGTGAAFLLVHRSVLEAMEPGTWFDNLPILDAAGKAKPGEWFGEDLSFFYRLREAGVPVHVDTSVEVSHRKAVWIDTGVFDQQRATAASAVTVVVPVKDNLDLTRRTLASLYEAGGYDDLLIFDNGSEDPAMRSWLEVIAAEGLADVFDASDADGIHAMWNAGIDEARRRHGGLADVVFLNNDLDLGPGFLQRLIAGLRSAPGLLAVCGNYDGRRGPGVQRVQGICAGRYDGTGGLAGFAFAVRAELLASFRFPEDCKWFFGDNDLCAHIDEVGGWYGVVTDAPVVHVDGGGQTTTVGGAATHGAGWFESLSPRMQEAYRADEAAFNARRKAAA